MTWETTGVHCKSGQVREKGRQGKTKRDWKNRNEHMAMPFILGKYLCYFVCLLLYCCYQL